jgi:exosortase/archaeosortase family protein
VKAVAKRRASVGTELLLAVAICLAGYYGAAEWLRLHETAWVVGALHLIGEDRVSDVLPGHILMFRDDGELVNGVVTTSCSSILTVVGLTALTVAVLRGRRQHAFLGLLVALVAVVVANDLRLAASTYAGLAWGRPALVLFHDWVGTVWTLAATLGGFLLMVCISLPAAERAEQDVAGRHTARRPSSWARPGLGYRAEEQLEGPAGRRSHRITSFYYRYVLPKRISRWLARRRESGRIDYRIGHLGTADRVTRVTALAADGLGAHTASLLAVATYEREPEVLDALARAVAARQWEPVTNDRVAALRLWARGWLQSRRTEPAAPARTAARAVPTTTTTPTPTPEPARAPGTLPRSFARPPRSVRRYDSEDLR